MPDTSSVHDVLHPKASEISDLLTSLVADCAAATTAAAQVLGSSHAVTAQVNALTTAASNVLGKSDWLRDSLGMIPSEIVKPGTRGMPI